MTHAAQQFHLSPGAVSLQLHSLAEELHAELFVRSGKRLVATPAAVRLAEHAKDVVRTIARSSRNSPTMFRRMCARSSLPPGLLP